MSGKSSLHMATEGRLLDAGLSGIGSNGFSSAPADSVILAKESIRELEIVMESYLSAKARRERLSGRSGTARLSGTASIGSS